MRRVIPAAMMLAAVGFLVLTTAGSVEAGTTHVVQPGENLYRIALRYGVTVHALAAYNGISNVTLIRVGQVLRIPTTGSRERVSTATPSVKKTPGVQSASPVRTVSYRYIVRHGDTLYSIATRFGITVATLKRANSLTDNFLHSGQVLLVPGVKVTAQTPPPGPTVKVKGPIESKADSEPVAVPPTVEANVGDTVTIQRPLRVRRGPGNYFTTLALVAPQTQLVVTARSAAWTEVQLPGGDAGWVPQGDLSGAPVSRPQIKAQLATGDMIVHEAMQYLGTRYVWGGVSSSGLDCSGFIYIVFSTFAPDLLRLSSYDYFRMGAPVDQAALQPGDLVFFTTYAPGASHVGIYVGDHKFIHASTSGRHVAIASLDEDYYVTRYVGARRLVEPTPTATP
jgi:peptidoglycan endopeptidase LytE